VHIGRYIVTIYFLENPTYGPTFFRHKFTISSLSFLFLVFEYVFIAIFLIGVYSLRFQMSHSLYLRIVQVVE
jgi:hypothetical protein